MGLPFFLAALALTAKRADRTQPVRWTSGRPGSTFSQTPDGKYIYGLSDGDLAVSMSVDSQELEKVRHRSLPLISIRLEVHYSGGRSIALTTTQIALEFVDHHRVIASVLAPDELSQRIQAGMENLTDVTEREVRKHPEKKQQQESTLQAHLKDMTDLVGFTSLYSVRESTLNSENPAVGGWIFFDAKNRWVGKWKPQEAFILRIPVAARVFEIPFSLPPQKGDLVLRRRDP